MKTYNIIALLSVVLLLNACAGAQKNAESGLTEINPREVAQNLNDLKASSD